MSQWNLDMTYTNNLKLCDAVMEAATHAKWFFEMQELIDLVDFTEREYQRAAKNKIGLLNLKNSWESIVKSRNISSHRF